MRILSSSPNERTATTSCEIGAVIYLFVRHDSLHMMPLTVFRDLVMAPLEVGQLQLFYDEYGDACGYITWALLSEEVENAVLEGRKEVMTFDEWNEGDRLWIMDFHARRGFAMTIARWASKHMFKGHTQVKYMRKLSGNRGGLKAQVFCRPATKSV